MSNTPETDELVASINSDQNLVRFEYDFVEMTDHARKLERERNQARVEIEVWKNKFQIAVDLAAKAENELFAVKAELNRIKK